MQNRSATEKMTSSLLVYDPVISHPSLKQYLHRLDPSQDPICPNCRLEEQDLCECPALMAIRQRVFGYHQGSLEWLATRPGDVVSY